MHSQTQLKTQQDKIPDPVKISKLLSDCESEGWLVRLARFERATFRSGDRSARSRLIQSMEPNRHLHKAKEIGPIPGRDS